MKSVGGFLRNVVQRKEGGLVGRTFRVGAHTIRVEAHLGDGGFASIYRVRDTSSNSVFALKHMRMGGEREALADCHTEVDTMQKLRDHPNILTLRAVAYVGPKGAEQEAFLLLDLCRESLVDYMRAAGGPLPDSDVLTIFHSVCKAVAIMHHQNPPLSHRDLKAENVLLHNSGTWVLCDFGSTTSWAGCYEGSNEIMVAEENIRKYTTAAYRAPEMFDLYSRECIDTKADMWALGVLLYYICFQQLPFVGDCKLQVLNGDYSLPSTRPQPFLDLINGLLCVSPAKRLGIDAVLQRLECLTSNLPPKSLPSGQPSVHTAANSRENGGSTSDMTAKIAASGPAGSSQGRARNGGSAAQSGAGGGGWDAGGWDVGSWDQLPSSTGAPTPVAPTQETHPTVSPRREQVSMASTAAPAREEPLLVPSTSIPKPPDEPKPLTPARAGASGNFAPKLQMSSPSVPGLRQSSSLKALGGSRGGLDLMDAPAQLTSRSLDRGTSVASPSADSDADAERRDSGGSRGSAGDAASRAALMQQLSELSDINRQLTAAIEDKDVIIAQLQVDIEQAKLSKRASAADMQRVNDSNKSHGVLVDDGWVASFGDRGKSRGPARSIAAEMVQPTSGAAAPQPPVRRSVSPWGKEGSAEPGTLSPDHPLKSLEESLSQLDPFTHASEPLMAGPVECPASTGSLKPSRLGMKLRGSSFEAFEDLEDVVSSDAGHISPPPGSTPSASAAEPSQESVGKKVKGPRHRRTTRQALILCDVLVDNTNNSLPAIGAVWSYSLVECPCLCLAAVLACSDGGAYCVTCWMQ